MHPFEEKVLEYMGRHAMVSKGDKVLLSLSAGKDSMALLHVLSNNRESLRIELGIFHLNHLTRGKASDEDLLFAQRLAEEKHIPFYGKTHDFASDDFGGQSFEEFARDIRYTLAEDICREYGYAKLAVAHNSQDSAETILMRLFSGTGLFGLKGIAPVRGKVIRPLLCVSVEEIIAYLNDEGVYWREDATNASDVYTRNYVRNKLLPLIAAKFPDYLRALESLSDVAESYIAMADDLAAARGDIVCDEGFTAFKVTSDDMPKGLFEHLLANAFRNFGKYANGRAIKEIKRNFYSDSCGGKANKLLYAKGGVVVRKRGSVVEIYNGEVPTLPQWEYTVRIKDVVAAEDAGFMLFIKETGAVIKIKKASYEDFAARDSLCKAVFVAIPVQTESFILRNRREEDKISLAFGTRKIKDLFIDNKFTAEKKAEIPLLEIERRIAAVMLGFVSDTLSRVAVSAMVSRESKNIFVFEPQQTTSNKCEET